MAHYLKRKRQKAKIVTTTSNTGMLLWVADQKGFLSDFDVSLKLRNVPYNHKGLELLLSGEADIASLVETNVTFLGLEKGKLPVKCFASIMGRYSNELLLRSENASEADIKGKTIGFTPRSSAQTHILWFLKANNLSKSDIKLKALSPQALPDALARGDIDAMCCWKPYTLYARIALNDLGIPYTALGNKAPKDQVVLAANKTFLIENEAMVRGLLCALKEAEKFCLANKDETIAIFAERMKVSVNDLLSYWEDFEPYLRPVDETFLQNVQMLAKWVLEEDTAYRGKALPDYGDLIDRDIFLDFFTENN
jgi:NitT/TauT family transport system substrate-binding protein